MIIDNLNEIILHLIGIYLVYNIYQNIRFYVLGEKSKNWDISTCKILLSKLNSYSFYQVSSSLPISYKLRVSYEFTINGINYYSNIISFDKEFWYFSEDSAKKAVDHFIVGEEYNVFYDPQDPSKSVLRVGNSFVNSLLISIYSFCFLIYIFIVFTA
jgi:hypothetical protein